MHCHTVIELDAGGNQYFTYNGKDHPILHRLSLYYDHSS
jgi:hypothetical protein